MSLEKVKGRKKYVYSAPFNGCRTFSVTQFKLYIGMEHLPTGAIFYEEVAHPQMIEEDAISLPYLARSFTEEHKAVASGSSRQICQMQMYHGL